MIVWLCAEGDQSRSRGGYVGSSGAWFQCAAASTLQVVLVVGRVAAGAVPFVGFEKIT